jgi:hypothetical protein
LLENGDFIYNHFGKVFYDDYDNYPEEEIQLDDEIDRNFNKSLLEKGIRLMEVFFFFD